MGLYGNKFCDTPFFLNEAYFGKSETLLKMEEYIGKIRDEYSRFKDNAATENCQLFNRLMEQQFGMEVFALHIIPSKIKNAFTNPIATRFDVFLKNDLSKKVKMDKDRGYYFDKDNGLCIICTIYGGLLEDKKISNAEILAILLHELGHNFADAVNNNIKAYNRGLVFTQILLQIISAISSSFKTLPISIVSDIYNTNTFIKYHETDRTEKKFGAILTGIDFKFGDIAMNVSEFFSRISFGLGNKINKLFAKLNKLFESDNIHAPKQNEMLSDKFATIYGYGPELQSALSKMTLNTGSVEQFVEKIPLFGPMMNLSYAESTSDFFKYDEHPQLIQRINSSISALEFELNKHNLDPKLEKTIKSQINDLKKTKDRVMTIEKDATKAQQFRANYNAYVNKEFPDSINKQIEEKINKELDEYC